MDTSRPPPANHPTPDLIPTDVAAAIVSGGPNLVRCVIKLASLGLGHEAILAAATTRASGSIPAISLPTGAPRPLTINAWSFLSDRNQHFGVYGMPPADAAELRELFRQDREAAVARVTAFVTAHLRRTGSTRAVRVSLDGAPVTDDHAGQQPASMQDDGGLRALRVVIKANPGLYGQYQFTAVPTGRNDAEAFRVNLGGGLSAVGQSKALAIAAARLIRVHGRERDDVRRFVRAVVAGRFRGPNDLPSQLWDGILGPYEEAPADPAVREETVVGGRGSRAHHE